jgi:hypothetical protein
MADVQVRKSWTGDDEADWVTRDLRDWLGGTVGHDHIEPRIDALNNLLVRLAEKLVERGVLSVADLIEATGESDDFVREAPKEKGNG